VSVGGVVVTLHAGGRRGPVVGSSRAFSVDRRRRVTVFLSGTLSARRYTAAASGLDFAGRRVSAHRAFRLR
jgi:hypothetical protein